MVAPICSGINEDSTRCNRVAWERPIMTRCSDHQYSFSPRLDRPLTCSTRLEDGSFCPRVAFHVPVMSRCFDHYVYAPVGTLDSRPAVVYESEIEAQIDSSDSDDDTSDTESGASTIVPERALLPAVTTKSVVLYYLLALVLAIGIVTTSILIATELSQTTAPLTTPNATKPAGCKLSVYCPGPATCIVYSEPLPTEGSSFWSGTRELTVFIPSRSNINPFVTAARSTLRPLVRGWRWLSVSATALLREWYVGPLPDGDVLMAWTSFGTVDEWFRTVDRYIGGYVPGDLGIRHRRRTF
ncbi:hypothetical protein EKO04_011617 [Ascochyta lentis]|uniref:Uncharacterized protein n=1 Tax=Ascochyta lentis TaxID=205686 RepID=A0A8H7MEQ8_9PLEO|nr:hypothetical protein EKO04_011617 [Ascochyta lentis]